MLAKTFEKWSNGICPDLRNKDRNVYAKNILEAKRSNGID